MKKQEKPTTGQSLASVILDGNGRRILKHILSPLELAALRHDYKSFVYPYNGIDVTIGSEENKALLCFSCDKIKFFTRVVTKVRAGQAHKLPRHKKFLSSNIMAHHLPVYLVNRLRGQGCETIFHIAKRGRKRISQMRGIGKAALNELDKLFTKNGCPNLFV